jgi:hypothetical protein
MIQSTGRTTRSHPRSFVATGPGAEAVLLPALLLTALLLSACGGGSSPEAQAAGAPDSVDSAPSGVESFEAGAEAPAETVAGAPAPAPAPAPPAPARPMQPPRSTVEAVRPAERTDVDYPRTETLVPAAEVRPVVPAGVEIGAELQEALSTARNTVGSPFTARVTEDVLAADGMVVVPIGSLVRGRITEARESSGPDDPAMLRLQVESLVIRGTTHPVVATVVSADVQAEARDSAGRTAAKVATGAAAGAIVGRILGRDARSTTAGAVAGAAAGTAVALATRDGQAEMGAGSRLVIRVEESVLPD